MSKSTARKGLTLPELMVVIGLIVLLMAVLLPALNMVRNQSLMGSSMNNMRQIAIWTRAYERDNREFILPSQFDYNPKHFTHKGNVRATQWKGTPVDPQVGERHRGTWADILWTINEIGTFPEAVTTLGHDYRYDAPDKALYELLGTVPNNPLRAAAMNRRDHVSPGNEPGTGPGIAKPYGPGAHEAGHPGFFAANDFFDARPADVLGSPAAPPYNGDPAPATGRWWTTGQIRAPERSMYLIDSFAGEVIGPVDNPAPPFDNQPATTGHRPIEVDFRYSGVALMLMLDGSVRPEGQWNNLNDLESRGVRVRELDKRVAGPIPPPPSGP